MYFTRYSNDEVTIKFGSQLDDNPSITDYSPITADYGFEKNVFEILKRANFSKSLKYSPYISFVASFCYPSTILLSFHSRILVIQFLSEPCVEPLRHIEK